MVWDGAKGRFIPEHGTSKYEIYATSSSSEDYYNKIAAAEVLWEPPDSYLTDNEIKQILRESQGNEVEYHKKVTAAGLRKQKQAFCIIITHSFISPMTINSSFSNCEVVEIPGAVF